MIQLHNVNEKYFADIAEIYSFYVCNTVATFEEEPPDGDELLRRWKLNEDLPFIVACDGAQVVGFAFVRPYHTRSAYRFTVEDAIYVHKDFTRQGIGKQLLSRLITDCERTTIKQVIARIPKWAGGDASIGLHNRLGFVEQGTLSKVGYKFDEFVDTVLMQKSLGFAGLS